MPTNLNALIRYKEIDRCLRNEYVHCTIKRMQESCSEQLAEFRGVYKLVSERTIRDDIKTLRSDALGFNAPILVKDGVYYYEDKDFTIFRENIEDLDLLIEISVLLQQEQSNISNPALSSILDKLKRKLGHKFPDLIQQNYSINASIKHESFDLSFSCEENVMPEFEIDKSALKKSLSMRRKERVRREFLSWSEILDIF